MLNKISVADMKFYRKRLRKLAVLLCAGLCGVMMLQSGHMVVKAIESGLIPSPISASDSTETVQSAPSLTDPRFELPSLGSGLSPSSEPASNTTELSSEPASEASAESPSETKPQTTSSDSATGRQLVAVNTSEVDPQESVSQVSPDQVAMNDWFGASFPVEDFQAYTSPFGYRSSPDGGYSTEFHYGLDMAAPEGSYIRNWWGGEVIEVSDDSNCGTSVVVQSGPWMHIYCHMRGHVEEDSRGRYMIDREGGLQIWEGQEITAGGRIGRVGMTGRTTGPHLHWGLKYDENWVDPALVLRAMYTNQRAAQAGSVQ
jgi:murein DD-endopeptidase MepM/ murein hydrolase activator NlpD